MPSLEELKDRIEDQASDKPEQFFAVEKIKQHGFTRGQCDNCGKYFWAQDEDRQVCGEPACADGYTFINDPPTEKTFDFTSAWQEFSEFMDDRGYTPIQRYPVAARWRDDTDFVRASIYDFQPYVVSGEVDPPANPLVVPQFCVRFNDIDNVGITGRHYTGFIMTGQHAFTAPDEYEQNRYFEDMLAWITDGMELPEDKIILHEDSWGGGGNLGACMEFFVDGLELFNQVYMLYRVDPDAEQGYSELESTKVLDMGMGHERIVWITHGSETSYEANMEQVVEKLYDATGVKPDKDIWRKFLPHSGLLNMDEVDDIEETWQHIADEIGVDKERLKDEVKPAAALYSIADHTRTLLIAFVDGMLPSNTGEKHSLRVIARRCMDFIDRYDWDIDLAEVMAWHADEMQGVFPELAENLEQAQRIIRHEREQYDKMREQAEREVEGLSDDDLTEQKLVELYDSHGISPEMLQRLGFAIDTPNDFYAKVAERHDTEQEHATEKDDEFDIGNLPGTEFLFRQDETQTEFDAEVLATFQRDRTTYVVLDRTCFYPTSGGQLHDEGELGGHQVTDVFKQEGVILHELEDGDIEVGDEIHGSIDWERRKQLMQHHSATHLVNGAAKQVLGNHVWQAGAKKTEDKGRLDITHYRSVTDDELQQIQDLANQWIEEGLPVEKEVMDKSDAEQEYGFRLYQGGVPPGNELRVVRVGDDLDVEACGGTHVDNTSEIEEVVLIGTKNVQDGVVRLEFKAGEAARDWRDFRAELREELETWIDVNRDLDEIAAIFDVDVADLPGVIERFVDEWEEQKHEIWDLEGKVEKPVDHEYDDRPHDPKELFQQWKQQKKDIERLEDMIEDQIKEELLKSDDQVVRDEIGIDDVGTLISIAQHVTGQDSDKAVILTGENAVIASRGEDSDHDLEAEVKEQAEVVQGGGDLVKGFKLKR
ncbi:MAG: alanine--tRNA ligase [Candidatus Nanohaloarchaea archaeon]|nr:alanine--tRNA ligase [Candidatus Nanohaloarchaea archaeon]